MNSKKPIALWVTQAVMALSALSYALELRQLADGTLNGAQIVGTLILNGSVVAASLFVLVNIEKRNPPALKWSRWYMIAMMLIYVVRNILAGIVYLPWPQYSPEELQVAALIEKVRYAWFIGMYVWLRRSRRAYQYLSKEETASNNAPQPTASGGG